MFLTYFLTFSLVYVQDKHMQDDADSSVGDTCEIRNQFSALRNTFAQSTVDASPAPIAPSASEGAADTHALGRVRVVDKSRSGSFRIFRLWWSHHQLRIPALLCLVLCGAIALMWERSLYDTSHALLHLTSSETTPTIVIAAAVVCRGAVTGVILLAAHLCGFTGGVVERAIYCHKTLFLISLLQLLSMALSVFSMTRLEWRHVLVFNPVTMFPPLSVLVSKAAFGREKSWPWSALLISVVLVAVCGAMAADGLEPSLLAREGETALSELAYSVVCFAAAVCFAVSINLWEKYFFDYPTHPLFAASYSASLEVLLLPIVVLLDIVPGLGFAKDAQDAVASFATLHHRMAAAPSSLSCVLVSHTLLSIVVFPYLSRCPAIVVPLFCALPLIAAAVFPGGALPVVIGGAYAFFVIMYLFVEDASYDESAVVNASRLCRTINRQLDTICWRHGCAVLGWFPKRIAGELDVGTAPTSGPSRFASALFMLGVLPISASRMGVVAFSARAFASRFANDWRGSYERVPATNVDD